MAVSSSRFCVFLLVVIVFLAGLLNSTSCLGHLELTNEHAALFIFGDSLFDAGMNNYINTTIDYQANFPPYGGTFFKYPTGRFSDGRLMTDFIAEYAMLPLIAPYLQPGNHEFVYGANFASAGAGALVETHQGFVVNCETQLGYFKDVEKQLRQKLGDKEAKQLISNSVYMFSFGGNDYLSYYHKKSTLFHSYTREEYVEMVMGNFTAAIKEIYKNGGRKFGFRNMEPLGGLPNFRDGDSMEELTALTQLHNEALSKNINKLQKQLNGVMYSLFDFYTSLSVRINNPSKYGFKEGKTACCGSGPYHGIESCGGKKGAIEYQVCDNAGEYLFFDAFHPTEPAYQQFAELMWSGNPNITGPYNLKSLFELPQGGNKRRDQ